MTVTFSKKALFLIGSGVVLLLIAIGLIGYQFLAAKKAIAPMVSQKVATNSSPTTSNTTQPTTTQTSATAADHTKLPLGDNKYSSSAKVGYIYTCQSSFNGGGAYQAGPWINQSAKTWDLTKKVSVDGAVKWTQKFTNVISGSNRVLTSNGLPNHTTGKYPIVSSDDAYTYDHNPNSIKEQSLSFTFPANPSLLSAPQCIGGEVGIMLSGIPLFDGFDAGGRDAVAWEIQDTCGGHPQVSGQYHYHGAASCLTDSSGAGQHSGLVGYAYDGFGIYGTNGEGGNEISTKNLDECHGHTHQISWDGKQVNMYHYHLTFDFPYSVSCFRAAKQVQAPTGGTEQTGGQQGGQMMPPPPNGGPPHQ